MADALGVGSVLRRMDSGTMVAASLGRRACIGSHSRVSFISFTRSLAWAS